MTAPEEARASGQRPVVTGEIDFTSVLLAHDAFTRDLRTLTEALLLGGAWTPRAATTWSTLARQLRIHRRAEDETLWPQLRIIAQPHRAALAELAREREHIGRAITAAETAYHAQRTSAYYDALNDLGRQLCEHMYHHERLALPVMATRLPPDGWAAYTARLRRLQGRGGSAEYVPWLLDGSTVSMSEAVLATLPAAARALYRLRWASRYRRSHLPKQWT